MTLVAETTHGDLDLSFGSVIRDRWATCMVIGVQDKSLNIDVVVLADTRAFPDAPIFKRPRIIPWTHIDDYEQVSADGAYERKIEASIVRAIERLKKGLDT